MLDVLRRGDQTGIQDVRIGILLDQVAAFLDEAFHPNALLAAWADAKLVAYLLKALVMFRCLLEMRTKCVLKPLIVGGLRHLWERLYQLLLSAVKVLEFFDVKVFECVQLHRSSAMNPVFFR